MVLLCSLLLSTQHILFQHAHVHGVSLVLVKGPSPHKTTPHCPLTPPPPVCVLWSCVQAPEQAEALVAEVAAVHSQLLSRCSWGNLVSRKLGLEAYMRRWGWRWWWGGEDRGCDMYRWKLSGATWRQGSWDWRHTCAGWCGGVVGEGGDPQKQSEWEMGGEGGSGGWVLGGTWCVKEAGTGGEHAQVGGGRRLGDVWVG